ncbi:phosphoglycerate kinase [Oligella ureolytica]
MASQKMAQLCDAFVNDAFGTAHRAQASTRTALPSSGQLASAGPSSKAELTALSVALETLSTRRGNC